MEGGGCAKRSGPSGEARRPPGKVVSRTLPATRDVMGEPRVRHPLDLWNGRCDETQQEYNMPYNMPLEQQKMAISGL